jgi:hypothetical protein
MELKVMNKLRKLWFAQLKIIGIQTLLSPATVMKTLILENLIIEFIN